MYTCFGKRLFDLLVVLISIVFLSPILILVAMLIALFDPGPVFFKQERLGKYGIGFLFYKFRSMPVNTRDLPSDKVGSVKLTWIGKFIRRTNLDELPQLLNILKGDMSVVGPRPPIPSQTELIDLRKKNGSLECAPGLTGLAQVKAFDGMTISQKAKFDGEYSKRITFISDLRIVLSTFIYLLKPPPVY